MLHSRSYTQSDDFALANLSGCRYKVLRYLVNRSDNRGVSFPTEETIAASTGYTPRSVQRALEDLAEGEWIQFVRRNQWDPVTRRKLPNAYIVNPDYICLATDAESEARAIWTALIAESRSRPSRLQSRINQQPTTITSVSNQLSGNQHHRTNINNQRSAELKPAAIPADYANQGKGQKSQGQKQNPESETSQRAARNTQRNAPAVDRGSAAPAKFVNPAGIHNPLDEWHEAMANKVRGLGIPLAMARGFVQEYGYDHCQAALSAVGEAVLNATADRPAGLFRHIIQRRLSDQTAAEAAQQYTHYRRPDVDDEPGY